MNWLSGKHRSIVLAENRTAHINTDAELWKVHDPLIHLPNPPSIPSSVHSLSHMFCFGFLLKHTGMLNLILCFYGETLILSVTHRGKWDTDNGKLFLVTRCRSKMGAEASNQMTKRPGTQICHWKCFFHFQNQNYVSFWATSVGKEKPEANKLPLVAKTISPQITCYLNLTASLDYKA